MRFTQLLKPLAAALLASGSVTAMSAEPAAGFPNKPVTIVLPFAAGASTDIETRLYQPRLIEFLKQPGSRF